ncbi:MAG: PLP-dependent transferase [Ruminococcaceae bacterium]|nr:PLP-dependent transferase [Oscillospiraceae bacterium]
MTEKDTLSILGDGDCLYEASVSPPIFQTSTFGGGGEYSYTRLSNPTRRALEKETAKLEGGKHAFAFSSGLAAINSVFSLLKKGNRVVVSDDLYGGTYRLITKIYQNYGIEFVFADMSSAQAVKTEIEKGADMVFAESPTNPMMKIAPLREIGEMCKQTGAVFVVDNTFLSPYFQNPLALGADITIHSATKFLSGHHDTVAGIAVTNRDDIAEALGMISMTLGNALSPFESWLVLRGIRTLPLRMQKHQQNAFALAEYLKTLPQIDKVYYPGLPEHSGHELCKSQSSGFGGVVSFTVKDAGTAKRLIKGGKIIKFAESLGGFCSLITYPLTQTHASIPEEMRQKIGITDRLLRLSVGLEDFADIKADITKMLEG